MSQFAVIGMGRFGYSLAVNLSRAGAQVIAIDSDPQIIEELRDKVTLAVAMDATDEHALKLQGVQYVDVAIVSIGENYEANLLTTVILKQLGVPKVLARASNTTRAQILKRVGADAVVQPEEESADQWTQRLLTTHLIQNVDLGNHYSLQEIIVPESWQGQLLKDLNLRNRHHINIVMIKKPQSGVMDPETGAATFQYEFPQADTLLNAEDRVILVGKSEALEQLPEH